MSNIATAIAIDIDQKFGVTFGRIGATCERLGAHLGEIGVIADVEPQGKDGLLGDGVNVVGEVQERLLLFSSAAEALGSDHTVLTLYTEETLEKLYRAVGELIPQEGGGGKDRIEFDGAVLIRGEHGIEALGGLRVVLERGLTPAAVELRTTIEMANSLEVFQPRLEKTRDETPYPGLENTR